MKRNTHQRQAIRKAFDKADRPLSPQEVHDLAKENAPAIGMATVYRTLKSMVDEKDIVALDIPGEPPRYERAGLAHHHHFSCRSCGKVYDFEGCPGGIQSLVPEGFTLDDHEIFLYGTCADCSDHAA